jgi:hypothetical protein
MESLAKYGTVEPIHLSRFQDEEYNYMFKTLAFRSAQAEDHPKLTLLAGEFIKLLRGSFVGAYSVAYFLRADLSLQFWLSTLDRFKDVTKSNLTVFGEHLSHNYKVCYPIDVSNFLPSHAAPLHLMQPRTEAEVSQRKLPKIKMTDIVANPSLRPKGDFDLLTWKSRIPPYTELCYYVPSSTQQQPKIPLRRKRDAEICL